MLRLENLYLIEKGKLAWFCFEVGMLIAYLGSLNPWFLWPLGGLYIVPSAFLIMFALFIGNSIKEPIFGRQDYLLPIMCYVILAYYLLFVNSGNLNGFIAQIFHVVVFFSLFRLNKEKLFDLTTFIARFMAVLLMISIPFYFLYLMGFSLPSVNVQYGDALYVYTNYFFFMVEDRALAAIIPRFHAVFLEPGHLGTATVLLLLAQSGHWKKWYNIVLLVATLMTFSLAAYVLLTVIIFLNLWMQGKHFVKKLLIVLSILSTITVSAFFYNDGENLLHDLILLRLEVDDEGNLSGDNRVADWFENEYESYLQSSDIFFGRDYDKSITGNSGYRVFIYENGIVGVLLVILLYVSSMMYASSKRALISSFIIAFLIFWVRGYPLWYSNFIPLYALVYVSMNKGGAVLDKIGNI